MKKLFVVMAAVFILVSATAVLAGPGRGGNGMHAGWGPQQGWGMQQSGPGMRQGWGMQSPGQALTPEQSTRLQSLYQSHLQEVTPLRNEMFAKQNELRALWAAPQPDQKQIAEKQNELFELRREMQELSAKYRLESQNPMK